MFDRFRLIRNVGQFDSVSAGANIAMPKLTVIHADNARGKTTLCGIMRSLRSGDPIPISERRRLERDAVPACRRATYGGAGDHLSE